MRGQRTDSSTRWTIPYELRSISDGIEEDLQNVIVQPVQWYRFSKESSRVDPVYDTGDFDGGRVWHDPVTVKAIHVSLQQGPQYHNERGFYTVDEIALIINQSEFAEKLPDMGLAPDPFLRDRIIFREQVYSPTDVMPRVLIGRYVVSVMVRAVQVKSEELINDPQFNWVVTRVQGGPFSHAFDRAFAQPEFDGTDVTGTANRPTPVEDYPTPAVYPEQTPVYPPYEDHDIYEPPA